MSKYVPNKKKTVKKNPSQGPSFNPSKIKKRPPMQKDMPIKKDITFRSGMTV